MAEAAQFTYHDDEELLVAVEAFLHDTDRAFVKSRDIALALGLEPGDRREANRNHTEIGKRLACLARRDDPPCAVWTGGDNSATWEVLA